MRQSAETGTVAVMLAILLGVCVAGHALAPVPFTTISLSESSGIEAARQVVVRTPEAWKTLWKEHAPGQPTPAVDFTKAMVVGVFLGSRNTAGYRVAITGIARDGSSAVVTYREERPSARDILAQVLTSPHHLVRVERIAGEVKFARADR